MHRLIFDGECISHDAVTSLSHDAVTSHDTIIKL
jgi:hypothetical protein